MQGSGGQVNRTEIPFWLHGRRLLRLGGDVCSFYTQKRDTKCEITSDGIMRAYTLAGRTEAGRHEGNRGWKIVTNFPENFAPIMFSATCLFC